MIEFFQTIHWLAVGQIILIDVLLGGDNAVVIALACRNLPANRRLQGILWGTFGAIILRVLLIFFALQLLEVPFLKVLGALLLIWIGIKLLAHQEPDHHDVQGGGSLWAAIKTIVIADFVMSLDNVIGVAGAAQTASPDHQTGLVIFGLLFSVPIIIWGSTLVLKLIDRYPIVVTLGAGLLGWIAGGLWVGDAIFMPYWGEAAANIKIISEVLGALGVVVVGRWLAARALAAKRQQSAS
jgi:YjbE family integral membrane protein